MPANAISKGAAVPSFPQMNASQSTSTKLSSAAPSPLFSRRSSSSETGDLAVIPPGRRPSRTHVLVFKSGDGLGHKYDACNNSNIVKFFDLLHRSGNDQTVYECVPSECRTLNPQSQFHTCEKVDKFLDKNLAVDLHSNFERAYHDLVTYYQVGDKISLFGFSRGAYTARALAEMIHKVGLLPSNAQTRIPFAYSLYMRAVDNDWHEAFAKFKELKPRTVRIDFIGVWDTVSSVGDVIPRTLPFTRSNTSIRVFRHALALHEPRASLHPKFYEQFDAQNGHDGTDVQEVWFAGSHCDVGGCAVSEDTSHSLGHISLRWMVRECFRANTGIQFHAEELRNIGLDPASLYPIVEDRPRSLRPHYHHFNSIAPRAPMASEEEHDVRDALSLVHDQSTVFALLWWILGFLPIWRRIPLGSPSDWNEQPKTVRMNLPRGLVIPNDHSGRRFYVHPTVHTRTQAESLREDRFN
ncbi:hypothetical protein LXA43DRAFT_1094487 [Ganoderma leucocontextum]|nr:hypothetical protein LXA43DRAFT_1094487 [Ganoderma leucocontextum]